MKNNKNRIVAAAVAAAQLFTSSVTASAASVSESYKPAAENNPISSQIFCADPTAVEYNGRLYVYGTSDQQQCDEKGIDEDNTYEKIKSIEIFSTDDMINWEYHGRINVGEIAPWIANSWAPSVVSRVEDDGLTHFYLYFSNSGMGVGVITSTDPVGPWSDPLGRPLINYDTKGLTDCPNPFDPGAVIDDNGVGWLAFGGGKAKDGTDYMPGSTRIVKLGADMISFDSDFTKIPAPYFFEASELNYINGTYVYTYCSDWNNHYKQWDYEKHGTTVPGGCSMIYMKTKTPLDPDSWEMGGECLKNPGEFGFDYSNNHTHLQKYKGKWYMLYHTLSLKRFMNIKGGYRSMCVDEVSVDEQNVIIEDKRGTKEGVTSPAGTISAYSSHPGAQICTGADITYDVSDGHSPLAVSDKAGAWTSFRSVDFSLDGDNVRKGFTANIKGSGTVEVRLDSPTGELVASITKDNGIAAEIPDIAGTHDLFFVFSREGMAVENWGFTAEGKTFVIDNKVIGISAIAAAAVIGAIVFAAAKAKAKKK